MTLPHDEDSFWRTDITERDLHFLYTWIDDIPLSRPKRNFTRDFSDGVLMAEVMHFYFPKFVELHNYSSANSIRQKRYNWETLNRKVLKRVGIEVSRSHLDAIVNCDPRAIESLLKMARVQILQPQRMERSSPEPLEPVEDVNNRHVMGRTAKQKTPPRVSQIPRAPSRSSTTPPRESTALRRPKSSFDICSSNEKDLIIKELQETNELLLAKISKLEQLLNLKDRKIESLVSKLHSPNNVYNGSSSP